MFTDCLFIFMFFMFKITNAYTAKSEILKSLLLARFNESYF